MEWGCAALFTTRKVVIVDDYVSHDITCFLRRVGFAICQNKCIVIITNKETKPTRKDGKQNEED